MRIFVLLNQVTWKTGKLKNRIRFKEPVYPKHVLLAIYMVHCFAYYGMMEIQKMAVTCSQVLRLSLPPWLITWQAWQSSEMALRQDLSHPFMLYSFMLAQS